MTYQPYQMPPRTTFAYFKAIWDTFVTTFVGLQITIRTWFFDPKLTIEYPDIDIRTGRLRPRERTSLTAWLSAFFNGNRPQGKAARYTGMLRSYIANRYRGILNVDMEICTACLACEKACPIDCIQILIEKDPDNPKLRTFRGFDIDLAKCMFCGLCEVPCPTGAIYHTKEFAHSTPDFSDFIRNYVHDSHRSIYKVKKSSPETIEV